MLVLLKVDLVLGGDDIVTEILDIKTKSCLPHLLKVQRCAPLLQRE